MPKKVYNFTYTQEEAELAAKLYADDFQLDTPIDMMVQMEYLDRARAILNKKEPEDTDVEPDNGRKEKPEAAPIPVHVEILLVGGEFMMPLQSVISMLSSCINQQHSQ
jgi:hypothetical protein